MTEHKFTDEEIIRALEICQKAKCWGDCEDMGCPAATKHGCRFYLRTDEDYEGVIQDEMLKDALDLINRQKAEIEDLKIKNEHLVAFLAEAKDEAVKEFAERLKTYYRSLDKTAGALVEYHIDQIAKEMLEGG